MMPLFDDPQTLSYDIIAIQEPWRNGEFWTTYHPHKDRFHLAYLENGHTRVCFFISKQIAQAEWYITNYSPDLCTLHLQIHPDRTVHIHNIYNPAPTTTNPRGCLPFLEEALSAGRGGEHVVLGDFNLNHPVWGGIHIPTTDRNSEDLLSVVEEHSLHLLLKKGMVTYEEAGHQSTIDLVFALSFISESLISCKVAKEIDYGSEHYPIITRFNLQTIQKEEKLRRQFKRTDISKLRTAMSEKITALRKEDLDSKEKIDEQVQALVNVIQQAIEVSTPLVKISHRSNPGFDRECKEAQVKAR